jgi:multiple antibiotic resistance protein
MNEMKNIFFSFISLFIAIDPIGILPFFIEFSRREVKKKRIIFQSLFTAGAIGFLFIFLGSGILRALRIKVSDFQIAGGIILFVLALNDIFVERKFGMLKDAGVVPLGVPLIVGPATLTTILLLNDMAGILITSFSFFLNLVFLLLMMVFSEKLFNLLGAKTLKAIGKIISLFLASIGVMLVRLGIESTIKELR